MSFLSPETIAELTRAAVDSELVYADRRILLAGIRSPFVALLPRNDTPLDQFSLYLIELNSVERLEDGSVPLVQFLKNAAGRLRLAGRVETDIFERRASEVQNRVQGVEVLPDPENLPEILRNEAIIFQDDMVKFEFLHDALEAGRSVCRVLVPRFEIGQARKLPDGKPWVMAGTGWVIARDLVITNHHVMSAREQGEAEGAAADFKAQAAGSTVDFNYDIDDGPSKKIDVLQVELANKFLDYAVVRLREEAPSRPLKLVSERIVIRPTTSLAVNIIQHPNGKSKRVAFRNNLVTGSDDQCLRYFTDTDAGSSGAPVCTDSWEVAALHRGAQYVNGVRFQGKTTAYVNVGTHVSAVLSDIKSQARDLFEEILE
jgi:V8-like Glu-specific endopeptidase